MSKKIRQEFADQMLKLGSKDKSIVVLVGDISHGILQPFAKKNQDRYYNIGICEQSIVNMAAGLSKVGLNPVVHTIAPFITERAYEQIKLNVKGWAENKGKIIFINSGHNGCYTDAGRGHLIDDDIALCNALNIETYTPTSRGGLIRYIKNKLKDKNGTSFIRLGWDNCEW